METTLAVKMHSRNLTPARQIKFSVHFFPSVASLCDARARPQGKIWLFVIVFIVTSAFTAIVMLIAGLFE